MNPYWDKDFFQFFVVLFRRLTGQINQGHLLTDEIQLLVLLGVSTSTVLLGNVLTLKRMTMLANSLSHTSLLGIVLAYLLALHCHIPFAMGVFLLVAACIAALLTVFLTQFTRDWLRLQEDASIGLVFTTLFAIGITLVTLFTRNSHIGVEIITGNSDALHVEDIGMVWMTTIIVLLSVVILFRYWVLVSFDENLASLLGIGTRRLHYLMMVLTALTVISAFRMVGILLVLSLIVGPPLIARRWSYHVLPIFIGSLIFSWVVSIVGVALSRHLLSVYHLSLSTGGIVVVLISIGYLFSTLLTFRFRQGLILRKSARE